MDQKMKMREVFADVATPGQIDGDCTRVKHDPWPHTDYILPIQGRNTV